MSNYSFINQLYQKILFNKLLLPIINKFDDIDITDIDIIYDKKLDEQTIKQIDEDTLLILERIRHVLYCKKHPTVKIGRYRAPNPVCYDLL
jgi:hypothetical protein